MNAPQELVARDRVEHRIGEVHAGLRGHVGVAPAVPPVARGARAKLARGSPNEDRLALGRVVSHRRSPPTGSPSTLFIAMAHRAATRHR